MENLQILKYCPWISDEVNIEEYFQEYNKILDELNGMKPHNEKFNMEESLRDFFHMPDDLEGPFSRRSTPALSLNTRSATIDSADENFLASKLGDADSKRKFEERKRFGSLPMRRKSADDIENSKAVDEDRNGLADDPFSVQKMEEDCSIDLLNVEGELPPRDLCESGPIGDSGRVSNWYAGAFMDGVIPDGGAEKLATLAFQAKELYKRETVRDYTRLRHRLLKYSSTVRMVMKKETCPRTSLWRKTRRSPA
ncbi:UNVERIFIED_CONTAM: hypothetical protein GTU68_010116 [Idotea baltica]|nr:hypothetical protein [Idotea baltica]